MIKKNKTKNRFPWVPTSQVCLAIFTGVMVIVLFFHWVTFKEHTQILQSQLASFQDETKILQSQLVSFQEQNKILQSQLASFREQTKISQSQLINQTRAWITVKGVSHQEIKAGQKLISSIEFINSGNSPALNLTIHNNCAIRKIPPPTPMELIPFKGEPSSAVLGPQIISQSIITGDILMTEELINGIETGDLHIYVWGIVKYDDIFGQHRQTGYCFKNKLGTTRFDACPENNYVK